MIRLVLDPGVLVSAAITPDGNPAKLLAAARAGELDLVACPHLIEELTDVLTRPKFRGYLSREQADAFAGVVVRIALAFPDPVRPPRTTRDPDDDYLLALASLSRARAVVSGDRDLIDLADPPVPILSPREAFSRVQRGRRRRKT